MNRGEAIIWKHLTNDPVIAALISKIGSDPTVLCDSLGERVKDGPHRTVWRLIGPWGDIHVKKNPLHDIRALARRMIRPSKSEMEAVNAFKLKSQGINSLEILGLGEEKKWGGAAWLISRSICNAVPLDKAFSSASAAELHQITKSFALSLARMHDAGAFHADLHPANILLESKEKVYYLDIHNLVWSFPNIHTRISNLVILNRWFQIRTTPWARTRFFREYFRVWQKSLVIGQYDYRALARLIEEKTHQSNQLLWANRDKRCLFTNREFHSLDHNGWKLNVYRPVNKDILSVLSSTSTHLPFSHTFKMSMTSTVGLIKIQAENILVDAVLKIIPHRRKLFDWLRSCWELPGRKAWRIGHAMRGRGLPTPLPLGYSFKMNLVGGEERLAVEFLPNSLQLDVWWTRHSEQPQKLMCMIIVLALIIRRMHLNGVRHRDLKAANILIDQQDSPWIVDLAGAALYRVVPEHIKLKDLARLARSAISLGLGLTACLRFFKAYEIGGLGPDWKSKWRFISKIVLDASLRQQRRGRPSG